MIAATCLSLVLGMVWFNLNIDQGAAKLGLFVFALAQARATLQVVLPPTSGLRLLRLSHSLCPLHPASPLDG